MHHPRFSVAGLHAVITGGNGMLGRRFAEVLTAEGARVSIFDLQKTSVLPPPGATEYLADATQLHLVEKAFAACGPAHILVNCAGRDTRPDAPLAGTGEFETFPEEFWDLTIDSHLKSAYMASRVFVKLFKEAKFTGGSIINISSTYGIVSPDQSVYEYRRKRGEKFYKPVAYSAAKAGMIGFTRALAEYCAPAIRVNALAPGGVLAGQEKPFIKEYAKRTMLGRMADITDYDGALLFLASPASAYMTGQVLVVDGGWTAR